MRAVRWCRTLISSALVAALLALPLVGITPDVVPTATASAPADQGPCVQPVEQGYHKVTIRSGDQWRSFLAYIPKGYTGKQQVPLVLDLHGSGSDGLIQLKLSQLETTADKHNFIIVAPNGAIPLGQGYAWNVPGVTVLGGGQVPHSAPSDITYLSSVIQTAKQQFCVDSSRVYATGFSGGARMTSQLACSLSDRVAAVAPISGLRAGSPTKNHLPDPGTCHPSRAVPVITFHGTADQINPYLGGGNSYWGYPVSLAEQRWAILDGCTAVPKVTKVSAHVTLTSYTNCKNKTQVDMYAISGGGHSWPGPNGIAKEINADELIWNFFSQYRL